MKNEKNHVVEITEKGTELHTITVSKKSKKKFDVYEMVNDKIIEMMKSGSFTWVKTWKGKKGEITDGWNYNLTTKKPYSMLNSMMLDFDKYKHNYKSNMWLTYKQAVSLGGNVTGQHAIGTVVYFTMFELDEIDPKTGKKKTIPYLKYSRVFNLDQITGIDAKNIPAISEAENYDDSETDKLIKFYIDREKLKLNHGGDRAYYSPTLDKIQLPVKKSFTSKNEYNATAFHEMIHSTGHKKRLDRLDKKNAAFGNKEYSKEELTAEIGASYLCAVFGFCDETIENSVAYLQNWIKVLENNKKWLVSAMGKAEKAVDFIINGYEFPVNPDDDKPKKSKVKKTEKVKTEKVKTTGENSPVVKKPEIKKPINENLTGSIDGKKFSDFIASLKLWTGKNSLAILSNMQITFKGNCIYMFADNTENRITKRFLVDVYTVDEKSIMVNTKEFLQSVNLFKNKNFAMKIDNEHLIFSDDNSSVKIKLVIDENNHYPEKQDSEYITYLQIKHAELVKTFKNTISHMSKNDCRYFLEGVYIEYKDNEIKFTATDGRRLAHITSVKSYGDDIKDFSIIVNPYYFLKVFTARKYADGDCITITVFKDYIEFQSDDYNTSLTTKIIDAVYPNYKRVIPDNITDSVMFKKSDFIDALKYLKPLVDKKTKRVFIVIEDNSMSIKDSENSTGTVFPIDNSNNAKTINCAFNIDYLIDFSKNVNSKYISIGYADFDKAMMFADAMDLRDFSVIMPMSID